MDDASEKDTRETSDCVIKHETEQMWNLKGQAGFSFANAQCMIEQRKPNKVLTCIPPPCRKRKLIRETRAKLPQLRSGFSWMPKTY